MYERMLERQTPPTYEDMILYCGGAGTLFQELNRMLRAEFHTQTLIRFPYGKKYGSGVKHCKKSRYICDIFAEAGAFTVMLRMTNRQFESVYDKLSESTQREIDGKYPCGDGGWIHLRILNRVQFDDAIGLLLVKLGEKRPV